MGISIFTVPEEELFGKGAMEDLIDSSSLGGADEVIVSDPLTLGYEEEVNRYQDQFAIQGYEHSFDGSSNEVPGKCTKGDRW